MKRYILMTTAALVVLGCAVQDDKAEEKIKKSVTQSVKSKVKKLETLQKELYDLAVKSTKDYNAKATYITVMDSSNGNLIAVVDSTVSLEKYKKDKTIFEKNMLQHSYEPGSVMMPIFYANALEQNTISPQDLVNCFGGEYKIGPKTITDHYKFDYISAQNVIVHSSNIGIVQITKDMNFYDMFENLKRFGFTKRSIFNYDELGENVGYIPNIEKLKHEIYKATISYGYGVQVNLLQLVRAYSVFNNDGVLIYPKDMHTFIGTAYEDTVADEPERVISSETASQVKSTLVEVVKRGTGVFANYDGVEIGGKTGTSHMIENNLYVNKYYNTFAGFANGQKNKYIIGVLIVDPRNDYFASKTAAPTFKKVVDFLVKKNYIK